MPAASAPSIPNDNSSFCELLVPFWFQAQAQAVSDGYHPYLVNINNPNKTFQSAGFQFNGGYPRRSFAHPCQHLPFDNQPLIQATTIDANHVLLQASQTPHLLHEGVHKG